MSQRADAEHLPEGGKAEAEIAFPQDPSISFIAAKMWLDGSSLIDRISRCAPASAAAPARYQCNIEGDSGGRSHVIVWEIADVLHAVQL